MADVIGAIIQRIDRLEQRAELAEQRADSAEKELEELKKKDASKTKEIEELKKNDASNTREIEDLKKCVASGVKKPAGTPLKLHRGLPGDFTLSPDNSVVFNNVGATLAAADVVVQKDLKAVYEVMVKGGIGGCVLAGWATSGYEAKKDGYGVGM